MSTTNTDAGGGRTADTHHTAGLFDIRNIIGGLLAIYGVILLLMGLFASTEESKTGGVNANLWTGTVLLVVGGAFIAWARLRPVEVDTSASGPDGETDEKHTPRMDTH